MYLRARNDRYVDLWYTCVSFHLKLLIHKCSHCHSRESTQVRANYRRANGLSGEKTLQFVERNTFEMAPCEILVLPSCFSKLHRSHVQQYTTNSEINEILLVAVTHKIFMVWLGDYK